MRVLYAAIFCGLFGTFCVTASVEAQSAAPDQVTVEQAVQEAIEKNLGLLAERYNLPIAEARIITAGLRPNPVLSLSSGLPDHTIFHSGTSR